MLKTAINRELIVGFIYDDGVAEEEARLQN